MSDEHGPKPPDTKNLWDDGSWGAIADGVAGQWFWATTLGAIAFILAVVYWIFL